MKTSKHYLWNTKAVCTWPPTTGRNNGWEYQDQMPTSITWNTPNPHRGCSPCSHYCQTKWKQAAERFIICLFQLLILYKVFMHGFIMQQLVCKTGPKKSGVCNKGHFHICSWCVVVLVQQHRFSSRGGHSTEKDVVVFSLVMVTHSTFLPKAISSKDLNKRKDIFFRFHKHKYGKFPFKKPVSIGKNWSVTKNPFFRCKCPKKNFTGLRGPRIQNAKK